MDYIKANKAKHYMLIACAVIYREWDEDTFLVIHPEKTVEPSHKDDVIKLM